MQKQNRKEETESIHTYNSLRPAIASQLVFEAGFQVNVGQTKSTHIYNLLHAILLSKTTAQGHHLALCYIPVVASRWFLSPIFSTMTRETGSWLQYDGCKLLLNPPKISAEFPMRRDIQYPIHKPKNQHVDP